MKIAYAVRHYSPEWDAISKYVRNLAALLRSSGHRTYLVTESAPASAPEFTAVVETRPSREGWDYFCDDQEYADRVHRTMRALHRETGLDVVEFADRGAEGLSVIRAKRLLGEFDGTRLVVRLHGPTELLATAAGDPEVSYPRSIRMFAEDYCVRHADLLTSPSGAVEGYARDRFRSALRCPQPLSAEDMTPVTPPADRPEFHVVFGGLLDPAGGADLFLEAADLIVRSAPQFTFTLYGVAGSRRHFGKPYVEHLKRLITEPLRGKVRIVTPTADTQVGAVRPGIWESARYCVFPARWDNLSHEALEAMSRGCVVVCGDGGGMAEIIDHGESGFLVDLGDPKHLAGFFLRPPPGLDRVAERAVLTARRTGDPADACARILSAYRSVPADPPRAAAEPGSAPLVSVIVPVFNKGRLVEETIASVRASDYSPVEIVVVDDGSTDPETRAVLDGLSDVVKISKENGGPGSAYNAGLAAARGEFVLPLDGDDLIDPGYLGTAVRALLSDTSLSYLTCYVRYFGILNLVHVPVGYVPDLMLFLDTEGKRSKVFRRSALEAVGGFDERLPTLDDWELQIRLARQGFGGDVIPQVLFSYRRHLTSLTFSSHAETFVDEIHHVLRKHADLVAGEGTNAVLHLLHLWKHKVELSRSAQWRLEAGGAPA
ncbi:glycosyltransferase [Streptosporangium sp. NPDC000396]|uniref:glycosyltransferase n=1 Tax=Streptosporangium sp. NPDC000396 TaxID=3366185 RepID=UPI00369B5B39